MTPGPPAEWHGPEAELDRLLAAVRQHCTCPPLARRLGDGRRCDAHGLLRDQATLDRLAFYRHNAALLRREEWAA